MAPRKQPKRLEESALQVVTRYCADAVMYRLENCNGAEVKSYITILKDEICADIPGILFNDFAVMFLQRISKVRDKCVKYRLKKYGQAVVDIIVDDRLTKLERFPRVEEFLMKLLYRNVDRLTDLRHLHIGYISRDHPKYLSNLKNCHLKHLTTFGCRHACTDEVLHLISERCPNLTTLDIQFSYEITSAGIDALKHCSKLRTVMWSCCNAQPNDPIINGLNSDKIKDITYIIGGPTVLMRFATGVYSKLKSLTIRIGVIRNAHLEVVAGSFPSLETLTLEGTQVLGDLRLLRPLSHLTTLVIDCWRGCEIEQVESLLTEVGNNYSSLCILVKGFQLQQVLNFVYKACKNIKSLGVSVRDVRTSYTITIPPFENLERLRLTVSGEIGMTMSKLINLQFTRLLALKELATVFCYADLKSILLDDDNFPCMTKIRETVFCSNDLKVMKKLIRKNNFDVSYSSIKEFEIAHSFVA